MTSPRARYTGDGAWEQVPEFSSSLKKRLRAFSPQQEAEVDPVLGHPADDFVNEILAEALWARSTLHWQRLDCTKQELRAECADLLSMLKAAEFRLRNLSPQVDRLLGVDADPLGCADSIESLIKFVETAELHVDDLPRARKPHHKQHDVALELAIRVLQVVRDHGLKDSATGDPHWDNASDAVGILQLLGDELKIVRSIATWRDTVAEAKRRMTNSREHRTLTDDAAE